MGMSLSKFDLAASGYERDLAAVRSAMDGASFDAAWAEGRAMSFEQTVEYALGHPTAPLKDEREDTQPPAAEGAVLSVFALGPARVQKGGHPLTSSQDWIHKPRELLFYLLSHPPRTKEHIGLALWPEASTSQLRSSFHDTVYRLRLALGAKEWIVFEKGRYAFNSSLDYFFDVEAFEENLSEARQLQGEAPERAIRHLQEATELYGGDFLEDFAVDSEWAMVRQEELRRAYQEALLLLGGLLYGQERPAEAADAYRKAIAHDGFMEEAHRGLMRSQAALGERSRAIRHYEELVEMLYEQLGTAPARESSELYERLRAGKEV
jgi:two-component SAPR family response regulator